MREEQWLSKDPQTSTSDGKMEETKWPCSLPGEVLHCDPEAGSESTEPAVAGGREFRETLLEEL